MKTKAFDYLKAAPAVPGFRLLKPDEKARKGDLLVFLDIFSDASCLRHFFRSGGCPLDYSGFIRIGRTLRQARRQFRNPAGFDGVIYRPLKK